MTESIQAVFAQWGAGDIKWGDSTSTFTQEDRLQTNGTTADTSAQYVDSAVIPLSSAAKTALGLAGTQYIDAAWAGLVAGTSLNKAGTPTLGVTSLSTAPVLATLPIAVGDNDGRMLTSSAYAGYLNNALAAISVTGVSSLAKAPGTSNVLATLNHLREEHGSLYGTGKDGAYKTGAVTDPATAPSGLSTSTTGGYIPAGTYSFKMTAGNCTGETLPTSASSTQVTTGSTSTITMTIAVSGDSDCAWRKIYRDDGGGTWRLVGFVPDNTTTTFTDGLPVGGAAAPGSNTTGATWSNPSGVWDFDGDLTIPATTVASTGAYKGYLKIRCRGVVTITGALTATGSFASYAGSTVPPIFSSGPQTGGTPFYGLSGGANTAAGAARGGKGYGSLVFPPAGLAGMGGTGESSTNAGGDPGGIIAIYAHSIIIDTGGSIAVNGGVGGNGSSGARGGSGGGAGGTVLLCARDLIWIKATTTATATGGAGGNGTGGGGASTAHGGGGGGGGWVYLIAPVIRNDGTASAGGGAAGSNASDSTANVSGGGGGANAGNGGDAGVGAGAPGAGTSGTVITASSVTGLRLPPHLL